MHVGGWVASFTGIRHGLRNWEKPGNETDPVVLRMRSYKLRSVGHFAVLKLASCGESGAGCSPCEP